MNNAGQQRQLAEAVPHADIIMPSMLELPWYASCSSEHMRKNQDHRTTGIEGMAHKIMLAGAILIAALVIPGCLTSGSSNESFSDFRQSHHYVSSHAPTHHRVHWKSPNHRNGQHSRGQHHTRSFRGSGTGKRR